MANKFLRRCIKAAFLLGCVFLLLNIAQAESKIEMMWKGDSQQVLEQVEELSKVLESYGDFLEEHAGESESELFTLIYLDNDDVPELVIMQSGWRLASAEIYTYEQGKTVYVGGYGQWGWTWYLEKEGIIFHPYDHQGRGDCSVHRIEGTRDTLLQTFDREPDVPTTNLDDWDGDSFIYKVDNEVVSEEQYEEAWQKWDSPDKKELECDYCTPVKGTDILAALTERLQAAQDESASNMSIDSINQVSAGITPKENDMERILEAPYAQAYYDFLQEYISGYEAAECEDKFGLLFIDDDEIPELLILQRNNRDTIGTKVYALYSYCEGQVISLGEYGYDIFGGMLYSEKSGVVIEQFSGKWSDDGDHLVFYRIGGGNSEEICHLYYGWGTGEDGKDTRFFQIDGISVQRDAFMAKWNELSNNHIDIFHAKTYSLKEMELLDTFIQAMARISLSLETEHMLWKRDSEPVLEQVSRQAEVLAAYETILDELAQKWSDTGRFTLIYLDDDDIPELAFIEGYAHISPVNIYTYDQGEAVYVGYYGSEAITAYWEKKGIIFNWFMSGSGVFGVHQVSGTEDTSLQVFNWEWEYLKETGDTKICYVDGLEVPEEYYDEEMQKWRDNAAEKVLDLDTCTPIKDADIGEALKEELQTLILTQYDTLKRNLLIKAGVKEDAILFMDYDDYDGDGIYEAFAFCGESKEEATYYSGDYWFVGADQCTRLPDRHGAGYRKIDGLMKLGFDEQKYLYYYSDYCFTANISGIWTVENGKPVEVHLPQSGQVVYRGDRWRFELWVDSYNNYYEPEGDFWSGHTWRPYFYHYDEETRQLKQDESENLSSDELKDICGFDLAGEVEAEGYEVTAIVRWKQSDIVTINYTIPPDEEDPFHTITYENIIWDCQARDYWRSKERGVSSWWNAGVGGRI